VKKVLLILVALLAFVGAASAQDEGGSVYVPSGKPTQGESVGAEDRMPSAEIVAQMENISLAFSCALSDAIAAGADTNTANALARGRLGWTQAGDRILLEKHAASGARPSAGPCTELPPVVYIIKPLQPPEGDPGSGYDCGDGLQYYTPQTCNGLWYAACYEPEWHPSAWGHQWQYFQWNPWTGLCYIQCTACIFDNIN
jgi:hypothetical protein